VLLYEIFHGKSPFVGSSHFVIYKNIINKNIHINQSLDPILK